MSEGEQRSAAPRVLFFGLPAGASAAVLAALMEGGIDIAGVVIPAATVPHLLPATPPPIAALPPPVANSMTLLGPAAPAGTLAVAWAAGKPTMAAHDLAHEETLAALSALGADAAVVACFTRRIPAALLRVPPLGFLNLHPSLLPAYRGPVPVFWQLRDGAQTGVTVHIMDEDLDTGDIVAQAAIDLPDGIAGPDAERMLMLAGADLLLDRLRSASQGLDLPRYPQPPGGSSFGFPGASDFTLSTTWPARRAFNFMRGTAGFGQSYPLEIAGRTVHLASADHFEPDLELDRPSVSHGRNILIRFTPGILYARAEG